MDISITLPDNFQSMTISELLEKEWLVPRKVRHFLRTRKGIAIGGQPVSFQHVPQAGDTLILHFEAEDYPAPKSQIGAAASLDILFEDEHLIILNKPINIKTHPNQPDETDTLLNHLAAYLTPKGDFPFVVHRLDRETSGCIVFAKNQFILPILSRMLENKQIYRRYQAVIAGKINEEHWIIRDKIGRHRHDRRKRVIDNRKGDFAVTHVEKAFYNTRTNETSVFCTLETGRTHQIRVHLSGNGYPIIGDSLYGGAANQRLMLHAFELHLIHPFSKEEIVVQAEPGLW